MGARNKLNTKGIQMALLLGAFAGFLFQSWTVFVLVVALIIGLSLYNKDIR
jgi:uncharacterized membrane protein